MVKEGRYIYYFLYFQKIQCTGIIVNEKELNSVNIFPDMLQILEANGSNLANVSHSKALEILRGTTHLSVTVQCNLLGEFKYH